MISIKQRAMEVAAASARNPSLARVLEDIYERLDAAEAAAAPPPAKKTARRAAKSGARK